MEAVKKPTPKIDPNHPLLIQRNRMIRQQQNYIAELAKNLLTKNAELKNMELQTQFVKQDLAE